MAAWTVGELRQKFAEAFKGKDFKTFNGLYQDFLKQYPSFSKSLSSGPTELAVQSAIFGRTGFYLKETPDTEVAGFLAGGRGASKVFGSLSVADRLAFLKVLEEKIKLHSDEIGLVISADTGKPVEIADKEMVKGAEWFEYAYSEAEKQLGTVGDATQKISMRPIGVAQIIGAYNYPYALAIGGIVGALMAGNSVIVSAPKKAPNWVFPFMRAANEAVTEFSANAAKEGKVWAEAFTKVAGNLIQCSIGVNRNLTAQADLVHFVGGDVTGRLIAKSREHRKTILEMGGSNVAVIMNSAVADEKAAAGIAQTIYEGFAPATGQRCTAPRMLCVEDGAEGVVTALSKIITEGDHHIGNPFVKGTKMGPLVDKGAHQKMDEAVALADEVGAKVYGSVAYTGNDVPIDENSFWVKPVVIDWGSVDMADAQKAERVKKLLGEEIFGPLLHVLPRVKGIDAAIAATNTYDTHGLAGAIFTANAEDVDAYAAGVSVTSLTVNDGTKDRSPAGPHGHPGISTIGGQGHFRLYASQALVAQPKLKPAPAAVPSA